MRLGHGGALVLYAAELHLRQACHDGVQCSFSRPQSAPPPPARGTALWQRHVEDSVGQTLIVARQRAHGMKHSMGPQLKVCGPGELGHCLFLQSEGTVLDIERVSDMRGRDSQALV